MKLTLYHILPMVKKLGIEPVLMIQTEYFLDGFMAYQHLLGYFMPKSI